MNTQFNPYYGLVGAALLVLAGCAEPTALEKDFGNSVRAMVAAQKYTPPTAVQPAPVPTGIDGKKAEQVLRVYREDISQPQEIKNEIQINVGGQ